MNKRLGVSIAAAFAAFLLTAPTASAATEVGWDCVADKTEADWTLLASGGTGVPMWSDIPAEGPKVITGWKVRVGLGLGPLPQRLEVFEIRDEDDYEKIGESATETLVEGTNAFPTRIPADEGDRIGLYGPGGTLVCDKEAGAISQLYEGSVATGETRAFKTVTEVGAPVSVIVEDDRDNDGFGDETQDRCPASAAYQDCPTVTASVVSKIVRRNAILVRTRVDNEGVVRVKGSVQMRRLERAAGDSASGVISVRLGAELPRTIAPGVTATFRLGLKKAVKRRLALLSPQKKLRAKITVTTTDLAQRQITRSVFVNLHGRNKDA